MALFVGLDVSLKTTSICIVEANGKVVWHAPLAWRTAIRDARRSWGLLGACHMLPR